jgi:RimJ/RimL family protein N-acetyltransferase
MFAPLKPGAALAQLNGPVLETGRLRLRQWREADIAPNTAMLADPVSGRFITVDNKPITDAFVGWRNAAIMAGHWALHGAGMFVVEEKSSGKFAGRVGPWSPVNWPGFEIGWGIASEFRGKGYAVEAARASIDWAFATFEIDEIIHCIDRENMASAAVARRLGAEKGREMDLFGHVADVWVTRREAWVVQRARPARYCRPRCVAVSTRSNLSSESIASAN